MKKTRKPVDPASPQLPPLQASMARLNLLKYLEPCAACLLDFEKKPDATPTEIATAVFTTIAEVRESHKAAMMMAMANLPHFAFLDSSDAPLDLSRLPEKQAASCRDLCNCQWVPLHENVLMLGNPGLGKTGLSVVLGKSAISKGYSTSFIRANDLFVTLRKAIREGNFDSKLRLYLRYDVLIIDDFGHPVTTYPEDARIFYELIDGRYKKKSTIITTNRETEEWPLLLGGDIKCTHAAVDRFLEACHLLMFQGKSRRLESFVAKNKELVATKASTAATATGATSETKAPVG